MTDDTEIAGRAIGPYWRSSEEPLTGAPVSRALAQALAARGARALLAEALGARSLDVDGRVALYTALVRLQEPDELPSASERPGLPFRLRILSELLSMFGMALEWNRGGGIALVRHEAGDPQSWSEGEVVLAETFDEETDLAIPGGLFSNDIFGPVTARDAMRASADLRRGVIVLPTTLDPWPRDPARGSIAHVPVLPAMTRPLIHLTSGKWATSDINDLYRVILAHAYEYASLRDRSAAEAALVEARDKLQNAYYALLANQEIDRPIYAFGDDDERRIMCGVTSLLTTKLQWTEVKTDFSGWGEPEVDAALAPGRARAPRAMLVEMTRPLLYGHLEAAGEVETIREAKALVADPARSPLVDRLLAEILAERPLLLACGDRFVAAFVTAHDDAEVTVSAPDLATLSPDGPGLVGLHLPLGRAAIDEARALIKGTPLPPLLTSETGFLARFVEKAGANTLRAGDLFDALERDPIDKGTSLPAMVFCGAWPDS